MQHASSPSAFNTIFMTVWIAMAIGGLAFSTLSRNAKLKRKVSRIVMIAAPLLFCLFAWHQGAQASEFAIFLPFLALITFLNLRNTRFCDACGATQHSRGFSRPRHCSQCGASLP
ncbi:hypothetical protein KIF53_21395 [Chromobacterium subtsugae]|uniref:Transmembrane protein n=1 Tax=Chromobacterium subtsugae TaxID=251747 RepID=A0ABS7FLP3_9NEIS|nr:MULTISPECIES: hypothetical protein [Chromobacterium]KUM02873.1 hypothetical protein Cv017_22395 [Chromobacterium subtsugae]KZE84090.1 hypothetical protein AWB61_05160 [Chromobacterium sp. F49]MBW7568613.1 hypothetical protein [Chromobacterium subtsugae]MBW8290199.1 hypothetical protein [Chromobacterium subtsugae]WSE93598.1 hypothetical protein U6115_10280 [Chromobacterium subtsugae]